MSRPAAIMALDSALPVQVMGLSSGPNRGSGDYFLGYTTVLIIGSGSMARELPLAFSKYTSWMSMKIEEAHVHLISDFLTSLLRINRLPSSTHSTYRIYCDLLSIPFHHALPDYFGGPGGLKIENYKKSREPHAWEQFQGASLKEAMHMLFSIPLPARLDYIVFPIVPGLFGTVIVSWHSPCHGGQTGFWILLRKPPWEHTSTPLSALTHPSSGLCQQRQQKTATTTNRKTNCHLSAIMAAALDSGGAPFGWNLPDCSQELSLCACGAQIWACTCLEDAIARQVNSQIPVYEAPSQSTSQARTSLDAPERQILDQNTSSDHSQMPFTSTEEKGKDGPTRRFSCPFFQHQPNMPNRNRICEGPGFNSIPKLKEHLFRCHCPKRITCDRCQEEFKDHEALRHHRRSQTACALVRIANHGQEMLDPDQVQSLRKRSDRNMSSAEKWNHLYRMIFRLDKLAPIPSPYFQRTSQRLAKATLINDRSVHDVFSEYLTKSSVQTEVYREIQCILSQHTRSSSAASALVTTLSRLMPQLLKDCQQEQLECSDHDPMNTQGCPEKTANYQETHEIVSQSASIPFSEKDGSVGSGSTWIGVSDAPW